MDRPLYGLCDAGLQFFATLRVFLIEIGFEQSMFDRALFYHRESQTIIGCYIDDLMIAGLHVAAWVALICKRFKVGEVIELVVGKS